MQALKLEPAGERLTILLVGAHSDDIEIGCGGTVLKLLADHPDASVHWVVFSASEERKREAEQSARNFLGDADATITVHGFRDGFFPYVGAEIKDAFEALKSVAPDVVFTHWSGDAHQDHRLLNELTWNTFRDHWVLEYEIPKFDGDLGRPGFFVPLTEAQARRKVDLLSESFPSQRGKSWYDADTFLGLMRLRGNECRAPGRYAEAFHCRKVTIA